MISRAAQRYTLEDLYRVADDKLKHGLSRGRLVSEPPPGALHGVVAANVVFALQCYAKAHGDGVVLTCDTWFVLARGPDTVRGPDVAYVSRARYVQLEDKRQPFPGAPDLAVEVLSPSDRERCVENKVQDFLRNGTSVVWIVDPHEQTVRVRSQQGAEILCVGDILGCPTLLPGLSLPLKQIFE